MENQVPEETKTERSSELLSLEQEMSAEFRDTYLGRTEEVLLEEEMEMDGKKYFTGYTKEYVKVAVPAEGQAANTLIRGRIKQRLFEEVYLMVEF